MPTAPVIFWFRDDLRLGDNRGLTAAIATGQPVVPVYILDDQSPGYWRLGAASRWWLHQSIDDLAHRIKKAGSSLVLRRGSALDLLPEIAKSAGADTVYCSRSYEPWAATLEVQLKDRLMVDAVEFKRFSGAMLREPEDMKTGAGEPYKVYTPFWRALAASGLSPRLRAAPRKLSPLPVKLHSESLENWRLCPVQPNWARGLESNWTPGEEAALRRLEDFLQTTISKYSDERNRPDLLSTSRLSPHLRFGEISVAACWSAASSFAAKHPHADKGCETFLKELAWREFSHHLLFHWPDLPEKPWRQEFAKFPWANNPDLLGRWQKGMTGFPIVDAGMRELWQTGWMHNRVRMICASFLIKDLMISWQEGARWFWDTLVDADLANNSASWQWVAGSGADAAPYFRIFNPVKQGQTFDPNGDYVRRFVPEISALPDVYLHCPWQASPEALKEAGVGLGRTYPFPVVDHAVARDHALAAFASMKSV